MSATAIRAARAFVELTIEKQLLGRDLRIVRSMVSGALDDIQRLGTRATLFGGGASAAFIPFVKAASDAQETLNKFNQVFGAQSRAANAFAAELSNNTGRSIDGLRDSLAAFNALFSGLGFDPTQAREMSQELTGLAVDFASFNNLSDSEALERFISAMSGSSEVVARFGINLKQAAVEQQLLAMGLADSMAEASEADKTLARLAIITESLGAQGATGDAVRTADQFANALRSVSSQAARIGRAIGSALLPAIEQVLPVVRDAFSGFARFLEDNPRITQGLALTAISITALGTALIGLAVVGKTILMVTGALTGLTLALRGFQILTGGMPALAAFMQGLAGTLRGVVTGIGALIPRVIALGGALKTMAVVGVKLSTILGRMAGIAGLAYGVFLLADAYGLAGKKAASLADQQERLAAVVEAGKSIATANTEARAESPAAAAARLREIDGIIATRQRAIAELAGRQRSGGGAASFFQDPTGQLAEEAAADVRQALADQHAAVQQLMEERQRLQEVVAEANKPSAGDPEQFQARRASLLDQQAMALGKMTQAQADYNDLLRNGFNEEQARALAQLNERLRSIQEQTQAQQQQADLQNRYVGLLEREAVLRGQMSDEQARINQLMREGLSLQAAQQIASVESRIQGLEQKPMAEKLAQRKQLSDRGQGADASTQKFFTFNRATEDLARKQLAEQQRMREILQQISDATNGTDVAVTL